MQKKFSKFTAGAALPAMLLLATAAGAQTQLTDGQSRTGQITSDSQIISDNIYYFDAYGVSGEAGQRVAINMQSDDFDTILEIGRMDGNRFQELGRDDDGGDGLNSRLVFTFPETGTYLVRARTFGAADTGTYLIEAEMLPPPPPPPPPTPIALGRMVEGSLDNNSPSYVPEGYGNMGRHYALYSLQGEAGQTVTITQHSDDFDSYLEVGGMTPLGFAVQQANDDGMPIDGGESIGLDSRLTVTFQQAGTMLIRATTLGGGAMGAYTLVAE